MEHAHLHEDQFLAVADIDAVARLHHAEVPAARAVLPFDALDRIGRAVDGRVRDLIHQRRQRA